MYQNFDNIGGPAHSAERVAQLRQQLASQGLTGFLLPRTDEYQNEYVPPNAEQLLWLTGFSGSWGIAAVLAEKAALFVDGRYTLQAQTQADLSIFEIVKIPDTKLGTWLTANLNEADRLGYDPRLHTVNEIKELEKAIGKSGAVLVPLENNPLAAMWTDRPLPSNEMIILHPPELAGKSAADKIGDIQAWLGDEKADAAIITALDSIAWLLNIRGNDLPHTPFVLSHIAVPASGKAVFFVDEAKIGDNIRQALVEIADIRTPAELANMLDSLGAQKAKVTLDPARSSQWFVNRLAGAGAEIIEAQDPCLLPKAKKNAAEIAGMQAAHLRDGVAMCRFLAWLDAQAAHVPQAPQLGSIPLDEISAAQQLEKFRRDAPELREISFDTISGAGPNGAIVHYRVTQSTNRALESSSLFLIDSGGQYVDGTTDITRTVAIGEPAAEMRRHFTLVLKGHIAIATARFPKGTRGCDLDAFARRALWQSGLDYDHGTGHGVGCYLSVHEGPQGLSKRAMAVLEPGMILSNEPGYYREGHYGIRIENLVLVSEAADIAGGDRPMMGFENLTLAPYDRRLIDITLLTSEEIEWVDRYHLDVAERLMDLLDEATRSWLMHSTAPLRIER